MYNATGTSLTPKACGPFLAPAIWGQFHWGDVQWGITEGNAALRHQWQQTGLPTSGISTTPVINRAGYYARCGGRKSSGYVIVIDRRLLHHQGVPEYAVADYVRNSAVPADYEVVLVARDGGALPAAIVADVRPWPNTAEGPPSVDIPATPSVPPA